MHLRSALVGSGLALILVGGIAFFGFATMANDMTWEERSTNPREWVKLQTYSDLGFILGGIGAFLLVVYYALYVRPEQKWGGD